jgi:hypothetical protein
MMPPANPGNSEMHANNRSPAVRISLTASQSSRPSLSDVALFIYDFDSLYEVSRLSLDPNYADYRFSRFALYRNGRPLKPKDRMRVDTIRLESPLELAATILAYSAAASSVLGALWLAIQLLEKISNFSLTRRKLALEVRQLERDLGLADGQVPSPSLQDPLDFFSRREAVPYIDTLINRIARSPVVIKEIQLDVIHIPDSQEPESD